MGPQNPRRSQQKPTIIERPQRRQGDIGWLPNDRPWIDGRVLIPESKKVVSIGGTRVRTL